MSAHGLEMLDHTVQLTHGWINALDNELGWNNKPRTFRLLRAILHALRDCLPVSEAAQFAAQLPTLLRGVFYEHWRPEQPPDGQWTLERFLTRLNAAFTNDPVEEGMADVAIITFDMLSQRISIGEIEDVLGTLPTDIRDLWLG